jgi:hypothetical protein
MGTDACLSDGNRQDLVGFARISIEKKGTPTFMEGLLLQWPNPKARITGASGAVLFPDPNSNSKFTVFVGAYFPICYASLPAWAVLCDRVHGSKDSLAYSSVQPDHGWHLNTDGRLSDLCSARPSWGMMGFRSERGTGRVFTGSAAPFLAPRQQRRVRAIKFSLPRFTRTTVVVRRSAIRTSWCPSGRSSGTGCVVPHAMGVRSINLRQAAIGSARPTSVIRTLALSTAATGKLAVIRGGKPADVRGTMLVTLARCGNRAERQRSGQRCHHLLC